MNLDKVYAESIAKEYAPRNTSKLIALRKLDRKAKLPAQVFTYSFGIAAALLLGLGMCLSMRVIGSGTSMMVLGIVLGLLGIVGASINYPIYKRLLENGKKKYAYDIVQLAKEISDTAI